MVEDRQAGARDAVAEPQPPDAEAVRGWIGGRLHDLHGEAVGRVDGVLVDARDGVPSWLVVRLGRFGRRTALPLELVAAAAGALWVPLAREVIRSAPPIPGRARLSVEDERRLAGHLGVPAGSGRLARIADRDAGDPGSAPG